jgi:flagellar biosynthesis chaperone FliJ
MAKIKRRGPSLEDKFLGNEPNWHGTEIPDNKLNGEYSNGANWFNYFHNPKSNAPIIIKFAQDVLKFSKDDIKALKKLPDWKVSSGVGNACRMHYAGFPLNRMGKPNEKDSVMDRISKKIKENLAEGYEVLEEIAATPPKVVIPIQERMRTKVMETIYSDFDEMVVDEWMDGNFDKIKFPTYSLLQTHKIKGSGINIFKDKVQFEYDVVSDAYHKRCDQAVEAYSHIKKGNLKKMLTTMEKIFEDINTLKTNNKVTKVPKAKKIKASDKQVEKLNYMVRDDTNKLTKTEKQIDKVLSNLTTKVKKPTGRINKDCILLRVL